MNGHERFAKSSQYEEQVKLEKLYQEDRERRIKELEQLIISSRNKPIYELLYKPEYGDYRQFVALLPTVSGFAFGQDFNHKSSMI